MSKVELIITNNYDEMSEKAADLFVDLIKRKPNATLGLATGSTPIGLYKKLIEKNKAKEISFKNIVTYNLDEYCDIPKEHEQSYYTFMNENLFKHIDINKDNTHLPEGQGDSKLNAQKYEEALKNAKIDIQLLGIGSNGHIGFNEPGTDFDIGVHDVQLTDNTIKDNARFFENDINKVPKKAITMGIRNILSAETIILVASGVNKSNAIKSIMSGIVDKAVPATALNTHKGKVYVIVDKDAASKL
jgi:glucosamine-6-phosphate deaminase